MRLFCKEYLVVELSLKPLIIFQCFLNNCVKHIVSLKPCFSLACLVVTKLFQHYYLSNNVLYLD